jgi:DNA mismatch endonuclease, patch repair protein
VTDIFPSYRRSEIISVIRSKGNRITELSFLPALRRSKIPEWWRHLALTETPIFSFRDARVAIFINGCPWRSGLPHGRISYENHNYWSIKLSRNKERDRTLNQELRCKKWKDIRICEHAVKNHMDLCIKKTPLFLKQNTIPKNNKTPRRKRSGYLRDSFHSPQAAGNLS